MIPLFRFSQRFELMTTGSFLPQKTSFFDSTDEKVVTGSIKRHNSFARLKMNTSDTSLRVGYYANYSSNSWLTVVVNGSVQETVTLVADATLRTVDVSLPVGQAKVVDLWEGPLSGFYEPSINTGGVITSVQMLGGKFKMLPPSKPQHRVVVYGDSISQGYPVIPAKSYVGLIRVSALFDGCITSYGSGGRSIEWDRSQPGLPTIAQILSDGLADVQSDGRQDLLITIGTNDWGFIATSAATFQSNVATLVDAVHTRQPNAKIHLVSPIIRLDESVPNSAGSTLSQFRSAMNAVASTRTPWCTYWDVSAVLTLADLGDGIHPNEGGYQQLANFFLGSILV